MNNNDDKVVVIEHIPGESGKSGDPGDRVGGRAKSYRIDRAQGVGSQYIACTADRSSNREPFREVRVFTPWFIFMIVVFSIMTAGGALV